MSHQCGYHLPCHDAPNIRALLIIGRATSLKDSWTKSLLYRTRSAQKIYRSMQILTTQFNNSMRDVILPVAMVFIICMQTVGFFLCIKYHTALPLPLLAAFSCVCVICLVFEVVTYPMLANVYETSVTFVNMYDGNLGREWRMSKRALPHLFASVGKTYIIKRETALTFISLVISVTVNLLVSFE